MLARGLEREHVAAQLLLQLLHHRADGRQGVCWVAPVDEEEGLQCEGDGRSKEKMARNSSVEQMAGQLTATLRST